MQIPNACAEVRIPESVHNFLVDAKIRGNLESYGEGLRGEVDHMIYDLQCRRFVKSSQWHEYGVGYRHGRHRPATSNRQGETQRPDACYS